MHRASPAPAAVRLDRSELRWIAAACVAAVPADLFAARASVAIGGLLLAVAALWVGRVLRTRALTAELHAVGELLEAAEADRGAAEADREAMAAREATMERALSDAADASERARARYAVEARHASAEAAAHARRTSAAAAREALHGINATLEVLSGANDSIGAGARPTPPPRSPVRSPPSPARPACSR